MLDTIPSFLICFIILSLPIFSDNLTAATLEEIAKALLSEIVPSYLLEKFFGDQSPFVISLSSILSVNL